MGRVLRQNLPPLDLSLIVKTMGIFSFIENTDLFVAHFHIYMSSSISVEAMTG